MKANTIFVPLEDWNEDSIFKFQGIVLLLVPLRRGWWHSKGRSAGTRSPGAPRRGAALGHRQGFGEEEVVGLRSRSRWRNRRHIRSPGHAPNLTEDITTQSRADSNSEGTAAAGVVGAIEVINQAKPKPLRTEEKATGAHGDQWSGNAPLLPVSQRCKAHRSLPGRGFAALAH